MKIACYQSNPMVGDIDGNISDMISAIENAKKSGAEIFLAPELSLTGYAVQDLILRPHFQKTANEAIQRFLDITDIIIIIALPFLDNHNLFNSIFIISQGTIISRYDKFSLPNYGVFDEKRYFHPGESLPISLNKNGIKYSFLICEDIWQDTPHRNRVLADNDLVLVPNASPFAYKKHDTRIKLFSDLAKEYQTAIVYVNQIGAEDGLIFDGASFAISSDGNLTYQATSFNTALDVIEAYKDNGLVYIKPEILEQYPQKISVIYQALVLGLADYCKKNHFKTIILGLSGGIDSALVLMIAVDALGADNVKTYMLHSKYNSAESISTAQYLAQNMKVEHEEIDIMPAFEILISSLGLQNLKHASHLAKNDVNIDLTLQNLQARIRGNILMAKANQYSGILVNTSNKSEIALGYGTLYGDLAGGYAVLKDVYKTIVYKLVAYRDPWHNLVPQHIIDRAPSAELKENQEDQDTLPPYDLLDRILEQMIEHKRSIAEIVAIGYDATIVEYVAKTLFANEYKRSQLAVGTKITDMAFNIDWRYPITKKIKL